MFRIQGSRGFSCWKSWARAAFHATPIQLATQPQYQTVVKHIVACFALAITHERKVFLIQRALTPALAEVLYHTVLAYYCPSFSTNCSRVPHTALVAGTSIVYTACSIWEHSHTYTFANRLFISTIYQRLIASPQEQSQCPEHYCNQLASHSSKSNGTGFGGHQGAEGWQGCTGAVHVEGKTHPATLHAMPQSCGIAHLLPDRGVPTTYATKLLKKRTCAALHVLASH